MNINITRLHKRMSDVTIRWSVNNQLRRNNDWFKKNLSFTSIVLLMLMIQLNAGNTQYFMAPVLSGH